MGNCQAADAATAAAAVIQHADGRVETAYSPLIAGDVMAANPGHYVAAIISVTRPSSSGSGGKQVRYLKLLGPDDTLQVANFYRLVSFEDVLREFGTKRRVRLSKLLRREQEVVKQRDEVDASSSSSPTEEEDSSGSDNESYIDSRSGRHTQWRPTLETIIETIS